MSKRIFLADWVRNTIDKCEILSCNGTRFELKRPRPQPVNMFVENGYSLAQIKICTSYTEAIAWIKQRRVEQIERLKKQVEVAEKKLSDVVKFYE